MVEAMGLDGMIASMIAACDRNPADDVEAALAELEAAMSEGRAVQDLHLARLLSLLEAPEGQPEQAALRSRIAESSRRVDSQSPGENASSRRSGSPVPAAPASPRWWMSFADGFWTKPLVVVWR